MQKQAQEERKYEWLSPNFMFWGVDCEKKWQSKLFLELGGGEATCPDTGLYSINLF